MNLRELCAIAIAILMGGLFFWFDVSHPLGTASPVLYVTIVAVGLLAHSPRLTIGLAFGGTILTLAGVLMSPYEGADVIVILTNRVLALLAIWAVAISGYVYMGMQKRLNVALTMLAETDELTSCLNRRRLLAELEYRVTEEQRYPNPLSILLIDIDHFKQVNDTHGHLVGDAVLQDTARVIAECNRAADLLGRYGGEEFLVICPGTDLTGAQQLAERMCEAMRANTVTHEGASVTVTISVGVAEFRADMGSVSEFLAAADQALYRAKDRGRDAVELHIPGDIAGEAILES